MPTNQSEWWSLSVADRRSALAAAQQAGYLPKDLRQALQVITATFGPDPSAPPPPTPQQAARLEVLNFARGLTSQEQIDHLARVYEQYGPPGLLSAIRVAGLSPAACRLVEGTIIKEGGFQGLVSAVQRNLYHEDLVADGRTIEEAVARAAPGPNDSPARAALKKSSPLFAMMSKPEVQAVALEACRKLGIQIPVGASPLEAYLSYARPIADGGIAGMGRKIGQEKMTHDEEIAALANLMGEPKADLEKMLSLVADADLKHGLLERTGKRDYDPSKPTISLTPTAKAETKARDERRSKLEAVYDRVEGAGRDQAGRFTARAPTAETPKAAPDRRTTVERRQDALSSAYDSIDRGETPNVSAPEPEADNRRSALEAAYDELDSQPDDQQRESA